MTKVIAIRRSKDEELALRLTAQKMYYEGYQPDEIARALNDTLSHSLLLTDDEIARWRDTFHWIRRPDPKPKERVSPSPAPGPSGPWESEWKSWMD